MSKEAKTTYEIHPYLKKRWSPRSFADKPVEEEKLRQLFEAARWTPSSSNEQPWYFFIGMKGDDTYNKIFDTLIEFNQIWCKLAPVLGMAVGRKFREKGGGEYINYQYDVGQSIAHLTFQAMHEDLYVHQMGGFSPEKAEQLFGIPPEFRPLTTFAIGYIGDPALLHPRMQKSEVAERERKDLESFVFEGEWGRKVRFL